MGDWLSFLRLTARAKTGVSGNVLLGGAGIAWAAMATGLWISITIFVFIGNNYEWPWKNQWVFAACMLLIGWLVVTGVFGIGTILVRNRAKRRAEATLAAQKAALFDPSMITVALEVGRAIGWRRLISLAGVALLASGLAKEWIGREAAEEPPAEED